MNKFVSGQWNAICDRCGFKFKSSELKKDWQGLQAFYASNIGASPAYVKLYNKATAPVVGTDIPDMIIPVPAAAAGVPGIAMLPIGFAGFRFALGLGIAELVS